MTSVIYSRLVGQAAALTMHSINALAMYVSMQDETIMRDPEIKTMVSMQNYYLTVWNIIAFRGQQVHSRAGGIVGAALVGPIGVTWRLSSTDEAVKLSATIVNMGFQLSYFFLAFVCDILTATGRDHLIPKSVRKFREAYFATLIWPVAMLIFVIFWPFFIANRELLFPAFIDKIFSFKSNMVMHFWILPAALWELSLLPRRVPKSHLKNIGALTVTFIVYNAVIFYIHSQRGLWPYPILKMIYGTINYPIFLVALYLLTLYCYNTQWKFTTIAWGEKTNLKKIKLR